MDRLTFEGDFCTIAMCQENPCPYDNSCTQREVWDRLKAYEDTGLEPEEIEKAMEDCADTVAKNQFAISDINEMGGVDRLRELIQAERDGRLVVLPCKVGDTVYAAETAPVVPLYVTHVGVWLDGADGGDWEDLKNIGKTVFLTREEAEAALKGCDEE